MAKVHKGPIYFLYDEHFCDGDFGKITAWLPCVVAIPLSMPLKVNLIKFLSRTLRLARECLVHSSPQSDGRPALLPK